MDRGPSRDFPRVVRLADLTPEQRRLVLALIEAARSSRSEVVPGERYLRKARTPGTNPIGE